MKYLVVKKHRTIIFLISILFFSHHTYAQQILDLFTTQSVQSRVASETILYRYLEPSLNGIAKNNNIGWYHTGKVHPPFSFDFYFNSTLVYAEDQDLVYQINDLTDVALINPDQNHLPTIIGQENQMNELLFDEGTRVVAPNGYDFFGIPYGSAHFGFGVGFNTELIGRVLPRINYKDFSIKTWGVGIKHGLFNWMYEDKKRPFDISLFAAYNVSDYTIDLKQTKSSEFEVEDPGVIVLESEGITLEGIISKRFEMFYIYASAGYNIYESKAYFKGNYNPSETAIFPLNFNKDLRYRFEGQNWKYTGGLKLTIGLIFLNMDYTYHLEDHIFSAGLGLAIR